MNDVVAILPHLWIVPLVALFFAGLGFLWNFVLAPRLADSYYADDWTMNGWKMVAIIWWFLGGLALLIWLAMLIPFQSKYHVYYELQGTVSVETNTFTDGTGDLAYTPVVYLDNYSDPIVVDNSRIMTLNGKDVDLLCTLEWVPYGMDVTNCTIRGIN